MPVDCAKLFAALLGVSVGLSILLVAPSHGGLSAGRASFGQAVGGPVRTQQNKFFNVYITTPGWLGPEDSPATVTFDATEGLWTTFAGSSQPFYSWMVCRSLGNTFTGGTCPVDEPYSPLNSSLTYTFVQPGAYASGPIFWTVTVLANESSEGLLASSTSVVYLDSSDQFSIINSGVTGSTNLSFIHVSRGFGETWTSGVLGQFDEGATLEYAQNLITDAANQSAVWLTQSPGFSSNFPVCDFLDPAYGPDLSLPIAGDTTPAGSARCLVSVTDQPGSLASGGCSVTLEMFSGDSAPVPTLSLCDIKQWVFADYNPFGKFGYSSGTPLDWAEGEIVMNTTVTSGAFSYLTDPLPFPWWPPWLPWWGPVVALLVLALLVHRVLKVQRGRVRDKPPPRLRFPP